MFFFLDSQDLQVYKLYQTYMSCFAFDTKTVKEYIT